MSRGSVNDQQYATITHSRREDTQEDILLQRLWEQSPFNIATQAVRSVVEGSSSSSLKAPLREIPIATQSLSEEQWNLYSRILALPEAESDVNFIPHVVHDCSDKRHRQCFRLDIAYLGSSFCGWQSQPTYKEQPSVQETLEDWLQPLYQPSRRAKQDYNHNKRPKLPTVDLRSAGRTDAGVHAVGQVARFRTWIPRLSTDCQEDQLLLMSSDELTEQQQELYSPDHNPQDVIMKHISQHPRAGHDFRCLAVTPVSSKFHPTFGATCRAYLYVLDVKPLKEELRNVTTTTSSPAIHTLVRYINGLLEPLIDQELEYFAMSYGRITTQTSLCRLAVARAFLAETQGDDDHDNPQEQALCIQLVGNRFLRRMVRKLAATALREAMVLMQQQDDGDSNNQDLVDQEDRLLNILRSKDRRQAARPAPSDGLVFAGASFANE